MYNPSEIIELSHRCFEINDNNLVLRMCQNRTSSVCHKGCLPFARIGRPDGPVHTINVSVLPE